MSADILSMGREGRAWGSGRCGDMECLTRDESPNFSEVGVDQELGELWIDAVKALQCADVMVVEGIVELF